GEHLEVGDGAGVECGELVVAHAGDLVTAGDFEIFHRSRSFRVTGRSGPVTSDRAGAHDTAPCGGGFLMLATVSAASGGCGGVAVVALGGEEPAASVATPPVCGYRWLAGLMVPPAVRTVEPL